MAPRHENDEDSSEVESDSGSESSGSERSRGSDSDGSHHLGAPTLGRFEESDASSRKGSRSPASSHSPASPPSHRSRSSRSQSPKSSYSASPRSEGGKAKSQSPAPSERSSSPDGGASAQSPASSKSGHSSRSGSHSPTFAKSGRSGSRGSQQSGSPDSHKSHSPGSRNASPSSRKSRSTCSHVSGSPASRKSGSLDSPKLGSPPSRKSRSPGSDKSGSPGSQKLSSRGNKLRSHSRSRSSSKSRSPQINGNKKNDGEADSDNSMIGTSKAMRRMKSLSEASSGGSPKNRGAGSRSGSDSEEAKSKPRKGVISDGSDEEPKDSATAEALFGDADDISSDEENKERGQDEDDEPRVTSDVEREQSGDEREDGERGEGEEEKEEEVTPETRIDVEIPRNVCDLGRDIHFVKLPNFLSVETRPFSGDTYEDEIDEEETLDEEGRARLKLKVENTIRWKEALDSDGNTIKESNARIVRWSDGSMSLHLGSEIFDVYKQPLQGDHNHLFIRQGTGLQGQAVFRTKLSFRPHSTESFTHRKMTLSLADRSQKTSGIKVLSQVGPDPDQNRDIKMKKEEEKLRSSLRQQVKPKRVSKSAGRLPANYIEAEKEEGSDDDGAISLNAIKNKYNQPKGDKKQNIYSSDDDASDLEARKPRRIDKTRVLRDSDDEDENARSGGRSAASDDS